MARTISRLASSPLLLLLHRAPSLTRTQTRSPSTEIPFTGNCGHSICALTGKRRLPISPPLGPYGLRAVEKLPSKAIRGLLASGPVTASFCSLEGLWSVGKQQDGVCPSRCFQRPKHESRQDHRTERKRETQLEEVQSFEWRVAVNGGTHGFCLNLTNEKCSIGIFVLDEKINQAYFETFVW